MWFANIMDRIDGQSSCHGKQRYSEDSARVAALAMRIKTHEPFEPYKCRHCEFWHIGHPKFWGWTDEQKKAADVIDFEGRYLIIEGE